MWGVSIPVVLVPILGMVIITASIDATNVAMNIITSYGYIDLRDLDWNENDSFSFGSGPYVVSTEPQKKGNPIGFIWPEEEKRIILP